MPFAVPVRSANIPTTNVPYSFNTTGQDPALITFTSGSTGLPKGVYRSHDFLANQHKAIENALHSQAGDIEINTLPVFVLSSIGSGLSSIIPDCDLRQPGAIDPHPIVHQIEHYNVNRILAPPSFCQRIADHLLSSGRQLHNITKVFTGGGPVFPNLLASLQQAFPEADVYAVYDSTEAEPIAHIAYHEISKEDLHLMQQGAGLLTRFPVPEVNLKILPDRFGKSLNAFSKTDFQQQILPQGKVGEIVVTGIHVLKAYLNNVNPDGIKFKIGNDTWHRTGDAGYLDEQGRLWLLGRCSARITTDNGEIIYPFSIETTALSYKEVSRAAFIQHRDRNILIVELANTSFDLQPLQQLNAVDDVRRLERLPVDKRHNSKVDYVSLRRMLEKG